MLEPMTPTHLPVVYQDADLLVVDKPAGLPVHPSSRYLTGTVVGRLAQKFGAGFAAPVHRLDRETSGLLVCARHRAAARALGFAWTRREVHKEYWAVCEGHAWHDAFDVDAPIAVGGALIRIGVRIDPGCGRRARTACFVVARRWRFGQPYTLVRALLHTGRRHQLRAHLRHVRLPIVGDKIYGASERYYELFARGALEAADWHRLRLPRQALHAGRLRFAHPADGRHLDLVAPWPADLAAFAGDFPEGRGMG